MESSGFLLQYNQQLSRPLNFTVSVLENSVEFYLEYVFIIKSINYRLFIRNSETVLVDKYFETEIEAKAAFQDYFGDKGWRKGIVPSWSKFFVPDLHWIEFLLSDYKKQ